MVMLNTYRVRSLSKFTTSDNSVMAERITPKYFNINHVMFLEHGGRYLLLSQGTAFAVISQRKTPGSDLSKNP